MGPAVGKAHIGRLHHGAARRRHGARQRPHRLLQGDLQHLVAGAHAVQHLPRAVSGRGVRKVDNPAREAGAGEGTQAVL